MNRLRTILQLKLIGKPATLVTMQLFSLHNLVQTIIKQYWGMPIRSHHSQSAKTLTHKAKRNPTSLKNSLVAKGGDIL